MQAERKQRLSLSGAWELGYTDIGTGSPSTVDFSINCAVPGDIHDAFVSAGLIKDPLIDDNSNECKWLEEKEFWYRREFAVMADFAREKTFLVFDGLDLSADVWLNGEAVGSADNAFIAHTFDVSRLLRQGLNTVIVRIDMGLSAVKDKPLLQMNEMWDNYQPYRVFMRKPQYVYGWDWTLWLPSCGIWKDVTLVSVGAAYIESAAVETVFPAEYDDFKPLDDGCEALLDFKIDVSTVTDMPYTLSVSVFPDERYEGWKAPVIYRPYYKPGELLPLGNCKLWYPGDFGRHYLYRIEIELSDADGILLDKKTFRHGARMVRLAEDVIDENNKTFTFVINGNRIFAKGANYAPTDCFPARLTPEHTTKLLELTEKCGINMLRVWGGGVYASDTFLEECDRRGIMIWHDFMFACGFYPDHDETFVANITNEAVEAVKRLRSHASVVGWSGNNEIGEMYLAKKSAIPDLPYYGEKIYFDILPKIVAEYQPDVIYRPQSPHGGSFPGDLAEGDQHVWKFTHHHNYEHRHDLWRFTDDRYKFLSEFGLIGAMNMEAVAKCVSKEHWRIDDPVWLHHNNAYQTLTSDLIARYFGLDPSSLPLERYILKSQVIQAEVTRHIYDEFRARKFECSGLLFWTLGDSFGVNNWAILDYYLGRRPVYDYLRRANAPVSLVLRGYDVQNDEGYLGYMNYFCGADAKPKPIEIWVVNDTLEAKYVTIESELLTFDGTVIKDDALFSEIAPNSTTKVGSMSVRGLIKHPESTVLYARMSIDGDIVSENKYLFAPFGKLSLRRPEVRTIFRSIPGGNEMLLLSDSFVWMLHLPEDDKITYSDNNFDLYPGRPKIVKVIGDLHNFVVGMGSAY